MSKLRFDVVSLFPEAFENFFNHGLIRKSFKEKIASYLIVSSITEGLYEKSFLDALAKSGVVYNPTPPNEAEKNQMSDKFSEEEYNITKDYMTELLKKLEEERES